MLSCNPVMTQDLRFAWRMIVKHRWFSAAIVATLALGIGLNTTVFAIVDAVLFKPVPVPGGERLVSVLTRDTKTNRRDRQRMPVSWPDFEYYRAHTKSLAALEAGSGDGAILSEKDVAPEHYRMFRITPGFFRLIHIAPIRGRDLTDADAKSGAPATILLGYGVWKDRYGGRDVVGRVVRVNGVPATIAGVMPEGLKYPNDEDVWMAFQPGADSLDRSKRPLQLFGMLKPGVTLMQAAADFDVMSRRLADEFPKDDRNMAALVQTFHQRYNGDQIRLVFLLMMGAVGLVLLIACANVANMLLGSALARRKEVSIRAALGASRWRIARQMLVESVMLSLLGSAAGLSLAAFGVHWFDLQTRNVGKPYWVQFTIDYRVFGYLALVCVLSALVFGLAPALRTSKAVNGALRDGSRSTGGRHGARLSGVLVVFQFGLTLVLLLGAAAFMRSFVAQQETNPWIPAEHLLTGRVNLPDERYKDADSRRRFFDELLKRLNAIPGVENAAMVSDLPSTGAGTHRIQIEGAPAMDKDHAPLANMVEFSPGYAAAIHLPLLRGRAFNETDGSAGHLNAIVTRDFAVRFWPDRDAVGRRFRFLDKDTPGEWIAVAGISGNLVQDTDAAHLPLLFLPCRQDSFDSMALVIPAARPKAVIPAVRAAVAGLDANLPIYDVSTFEEFEAHQIWFLRVFGVVFSVFASIALLMASVGIYAVMAQATGSRTREIGVRMALGATPRGIVALVLRRGTWQLGAGVAAGIAAAIPATMAMRGLPFLSAPSDPAMLAAVAMALATVGLFACWLPARRAAAINPVSAIRDE